MFEFLESLTGYILPFLFVFTTVVFFHELGHFLVARWCGVHVEVFSIGMGREVFGWTDGHGTRWKVAWIPLGGYVKMLGEEDDMMGNLTAGDETPASQIQSRQDGCYNKKNVYARMAISSAGPIANFILAIVVFWGIFSAVGIQVTAPQVDKVTEDSAAFEAGLQPGDIIRFIDGRKVENFNDVQRVVSISAGQNLVFDVERGGDLKRFVVTPRFGDVVDPFGNSHRAGVVGIAMIAGVEEATTRRLGPIDALAAGIDRTLYISGATLSYLGQLIVGTQDTSNLAGPLGIVDISAKVADRGIVALFSLVAILSISLGILNLLPIPVLDGGHILFYVIEAVKGSPLSERAQEYSMRGGLVLLLGLMIFVTVNDVVRLGIFSSGGSG